MPNAPEDASWILMGDVVLEQNVASSMNLGVFLETGKLEDKRSPQPRLLCSYSLSLSLSLKLRNFSFSPTLESE